MTSVNTRRRASEGFALRLALVAIALLAAAGGASFGDDSDYHDDGIIVPYVPPTEHIEYVDNLDPALVPTLRDHRGNGQRVERERRPAGSVQQFTISLRADGKWLNVYEGTTIGGSFGLVLPKTYTADAIRLNVHRWKGRIAINQINAYGCPTD